MDPQFWNKQYILCLSIGFEQQLQQLRIVMFLKDVHVLQALHPY